MFGPQAPIVINVPLATLGLLETCRTVEDARTPQLSSRPGAPKLAAAGTPCMVGVADADEGKHCIYDLAHGSFGWCYTKADKSEWGPCSDSCPVQASLLQFTNRVNRLTEKINSVMAELSPSDC